MLEPGPDAVLAPLGEAPSVILRHRGGASTLVALSPVGKVTDVWLPPASDLQLPTSANELIVRVSAKMFRPEQSDGSLAPKHE